MKVITLWEYSSAINEPFVADFNLFDICETVCNAINNLSPCCYAITLSIDCGYETIKRALDVGQKKDIKVWVNPTSYF